MAKIQHYDIGDLWTPEAIWKVDSDDDGVPDAVTDPSQIIVRQKTPSGVESVLTTASSPSSLTSASTPLARMSQGIFKLNPGISLTTSGYWFVRFEGIGAAEAAEEFEAIVDPSEFTGDAGLSDRALVTLSETKDWLNRNQIDTGEDLEIVRAINDISERFHDVAEREFKPFISNPSTRTFVVSQDAANCKKLYIGDLSALSTASDPVTIVASNWTSTIQTVSTANISGHPLVRRAWEPITSLEFGPQVVPLQYGQRVTVTGNWGFPEVPGNVRQAMLEAVGAVLDRDSEHYRQDFAPTPTAPEPGTVLVMQQGAQRILALPPAAQAVAESYRHSLVG